MSKRYIHLVDNSDITTGILFKALAETNPDAYPVGGIYMLLNGVMLVVTVNDGTTVTVSTVTVTIPA